MYANCICYIHKEIYFSELAHKTVGIAKFEIWREGKKLGQELKLQCTGKISSSSGKLWVCS
jgi:hypothetical protein